MKKIGYIDYYIDEFHANKGAVTLKKYNDEHGTDYRLAAVWAEIDKVGGMTTDEFCQKHSAEKCATIAELCEKVDYVIIFAPDNSEKKEEYALQALRFGKPVFMDKTFTDSYASAKRIFAAADAANTPLLSSSSVRYADELVPYMGGCNSLLAFGSGVDMVDYAVHYLEFVVACMGVGISTVRHEQRGQQEWVHITYGDGRQATLAISMGEWLPFHVFLTDRDGVTANLPIGSPIFERQLAAVIHFFETGDAGFDRAQTLELMKARDAIFQSKENHGVCVKL